MSRPGSFVAVTVSEAAELWTEPRLLLTKTEQLPCAVSVALETT
jgi:hypothetical protein